MKHNGIPVLLAEVHNKYQWRVWCPFCRKFHFHGRERGPDLPLGAKLTRKAGNHRVAHCTNPDSPFENTGYYLWSYPDEVKRVTKDMDPSFRDVEPNFPDDYPESTPSIPLDISQIEEGAK